MSDPILTRLEQEEPELAGQLARLEAARDDIRQQRERHVATLDDLDPAQDLGRRARALAGLELCDRALTREGRLIAQAAGALDAVRAQLAGHRRAMLARRTLDHQQSAAERRP